MLALSLSRMQRGRSMELYLAALLLVLGIGAAFAEFLANGSLLRALVAFVVPLALGAALVLAVLIIGSVASLYKRATLPRALRLAGKRDAAERLAAIPVGELVVDAVDDEENTALHLICRREPQGNHERVCAAIAQLARHGANPNVSNKSGERPLALAVRSGHGIETVRALLTAGADPAVDDSPGLGNAMYAACCRADGDAAPIVAELLRAGASVKMVTSWQRETLLHMAAQSGTAETVRILLGAGLNRQQRNREARTPLGVALRRNTGTERDAIVALLAPGKGA